jgi:elongation factor P hydroxylase
VCFATGYTLYSIDDGDAESHPGKNPTVKQSHMKIVEYLENGNNKTREMIRSDQCFEGGNHKYDGIRMD